MTTRRLLLRFRSDAEGASAVEFAAICPVLILFLLTAVYFGIYLSLVHSIQQLSADAARASIAGLDDTERQQLSTLYVNSEASTYFLVKPEHISVAASPDPDDPDAFQVTVRYDAADILGWYPTGLIPGLNTQIQRATVILNGGVE